MMTKEEIIRSYREAKNQRKQLRRLAELNDTTIQAIKTVLQEAGVPLPAPSPQKTISSVPAVDSWPGAVVDLTRTARLIELVEQGATAEEIAGEMGVSYGQALTWVARLCVLCEEYIAAAEGGGPE